MKVGEKAAPMTTIEERLAEVRATIERLRREGKPFDAAEKVANAFERELQSQKSTTMGQPTGVPRLDADDPWDSMLIDPESTRARTAEIKLGIKRGSRQRKKQYMANPPTLFAQTIKSLEAYEEAVLQVISGREPGGHCRSIGFQLTLDEQIDSVADLVEKEGYADLARDIRIGHHSLSGNAFSLLFGPPAGPEHLELRKRELKEVGFLLDLLLTGQAFLKLGPSEIGPAKGSGGMSKAEASRRAWDLYNADPDFKDKTSRGWAEDIGCSLGMVPALPARQQVMEERRSERGRQVEPPRAVDLPVKMLAVRGQEDYSAEVEDTMRKLIAEAGSPECREQLENMPPDERRRLVEAYEAQRDDHEPSPLDDDDPEGPPKQVRSPKTL